MRHQTFLGQNTYFYVSEIIVVMVIHGTTIPLQRPIYISKIQLNLIITTFPSMPFWFVSVLKKCLTHIKERINFWIKCIGCHGNKMTVKVHKSRQQIKKSLRLRSFSSFHFIISHLIKYGWSFNCCLEMNLIYEKQTIHGNHGNNPWEQMSWILK